MEPGSLLAPSNITAMDYVEGIPAIAQTMLPVISKMVKTYQANEGDLYSVRYENLTRSSEDFDSNVALVFDFMFGDLITPAERQTIEIEAQYEDLNRGLNGLSHADHHSND